MTIPSAMRGVQLTGYGGPEMLRLKDGIPTPSPAPADVVVKVAAAGVNNTDVNTRVGWYARGEVGGDDSTWSGAALRFPRIQGADVCGHIAVVGDAVDAARVGERVIIEPCLWEWDGKRMDSPYYLGSECDGGFAEYVRAPSRYAHAVNSALSDVELASFPCSYSTAENMLTRARVRKGDRVLVTGASGGVGSAAVQLARARGAHVIAVTSPAKADGLKALGAEQTVGRNDDLVEALGRNSVDVVIDLVAGRAWPALLDVMRPFGRYSVAGAIAGPLVELDVRTLYLKDLSFFGCTVLEPEVFANLVRRIESGAVEPLVAGVFPLEDIAAAQEAFQQKAHTGKLVLSVG